MDGKYFFSDADTDVVRECAAWSPGKGDHRLPCSVARGAVCVRDQVRIHRVANTSQHTVQASSLVFPAPDTDLHISPGRGAGHRVHLTRRLTSCGWQARYSLHAWHADNQSRRCGDIVILLSTSF